MRPGMISDDTAEKIRRLAATCIGAGTSLPEFLELLGQALPTNDKGLTPQDGAVALLRVAGFEPLVECAEGEARVVTRWRKA